MTRTTRLATGPVVAKTLHRESHNARRVSVANGMNAHFCLPNAGRAGTHQGGTRAISLFRGHSGDSRFSHRHCMFFEFQDREPVLHRGREQ